MTDEQQQPPAEGAQPAEEPEQAAVPARAGAPEPAEGGTGEGGPPRRTPARDEPSSAVRPQRAPHLGAGGQRGISAEAAPQRAIVRAAQRRRAGGMEVTRRQFMGASFWGVLGIGLTGSVAAFLAFFWPRGLTGFGGQIGVAAELVPEPGDDPVRLAIGKFWLVNLEPGEGTHGGFGEQGAGGLLALWWKCPHLGCTVPWRPTFGFEGATGWFRCPCHGSTYSKAGVRVFGPAPRPMDTMAIAVNADGSLTVDTGAITKGGQDNPTRAEPYSA